MAKHLESGSSVDISVADITCCDYHVKDLMGTSSDNKSSDIKVSNNVKRKNCVTFIYFDK